MFSVIFHLFYQTHPSFLEPERSPSKEMQTKPTHEFHKWNTRFEFHKFTDILWMQEKSTAEIGFVSRNFPHIHGILGQCWRVLCKCVGFVAGEVLLSFHLNLLVAIYMHRSLNDPITYFFFLGNFLPKDYWIYSRIILFVILISFACVLK